MSGLDVTIFAKFTSNENLIFFVLNLNSMDKETKSSMDQTVDLANTTVPAIPFLWYREEQIFCPFILISKIDPEKIKQIYQTDEDLGECYVLVQKNVLEKANVYACFHAYAYVKAHPSEEKVVKIPHNFCKSYHFRAIAVPITQFTPTEIQYVGPSFVKGQYSNGSAFIHDAAFSPPGDFRFRVNEQNDVNTILVNCHCPELNCRATCVFVLINCLKEGDNDAFVKEISDKVQQFVSS